MCEGFMARLFSGQIVLLSTISGHRTRRKLEDREYRSIRCTRALYNPNIREPRPCSCALRSIHKNSIKLRLTPMEGDRCFLQPLCCPNYLCPTPRHMEGTRAEGAVLLLIYHQHRYRPSTTLGHPRDCSFISIAEHHQLYFEVDREGSSSVHTTP